MPAEAHKTVGSLYKKRRPIDRGSTIVVAGGLDVLAVVYLFVVNFCIVSSSSTSAALVLIRKNKSRGTHSSCKIAEGGRTTAENAMFVFSAGRLASVAL